jgi:hypothetical protein
MASVGALLKPVPNDPLRSGMRAATRRVGREEVTGGFDADGNVRGECGRYSHLAGTFPFEYGEPLPSNFEAEISELGRAVSSDASQPLAVRTAARCAQTLGFRVR